MTDAFAILGLPRRAALDDEALRRAYAAKSRTAHPDCGGSEEAAAQSNAAYETLRAPDKRLKHLLELAAPESANPWRTVPMDDAMMGMFSELGKALEASAAFVGRKSKAETALARALLANEEMRHRESLEHIGLDLENSRTRMEAMLPGLDAAMQAGDPSVWKQLGLLQARFAYLAKWQAQIRERLLSLM